MSNAASSTKLLPTPTQKPKVPEVKVDGEKRARQQLVSNSEDEE
jgi:hypothetical protein